MWAHIISELGSVRGEGEVICSPDYCYPEIFRPSSGSPLHIAIDLNVILSTVLIFPRIQVFDIFFPIKFKNLIFLIAIGVI